MATKKGSGRGPGGEPLEVAILVRLTGEQDHLIREAAEWSGQRLTDFVRSAVTARAREVIAEKRRQTGVTGKV